MIDLHLDDPLVVGRPHSGLLQIAVHDKLQKCHLVKTSIKGNFLRFRGELPADTTIILVVHACVIDNRTLGADQETQFFPKPCVDVRSIRRVAEVCSGMGCLGVGLEEAGFEVAVRSDWSQPMLDLASRLHTSDTLLGDTCSDAILADLSRKFPDVRSLASGVSCQPYSRLGDQLHQKDPRSQTLPATLRIGFLGQYGLIFLECVAEAHSCPWVQQVISQFSKETGYTICQGVLSLQQVWPARRKRWWCTLAHPSLGVIPWQDFPTVHPQPMVSSVLEQFQACSQEMLSQLQLDLYELGKFAHHGFHSNMIPMQGQMATSLHSCGNQLMGCPCGCRQHPFTEQRLQSGGLHGLLVQLAGESKCGNNVYPNFRHITPDELALLNGMYPGCNWGPFSKLALCGLGQMASPLQSAWMGACAMQHIMKTLDLGEASKPEVVLLKLMGNLLNSRDEVFGPQSGATARAFSNMIHAMSFTQSKIHELSEKISNHEETKEHEHAMYGHHAAQVHDDAHRQSGDRTTVQPSHPTPAEAGKHMSIQAGQELASEAFVPSHPECVQKSSVLSNSPQPFEQVPLNKASETSDPRLPDDVQKVDFVMTQPQPFEDKHCGIVKDGEPPDTPVLTLADAPGHRSRVGYPTFPAATQSAQSENGDASEDVHRSAVHSIRSPPTGHQTTAADQGPANTNVNPTFTSPKCHALGATMNTTETPLVQLAAADVSDPGQNAHNVQIPRAEVVQMHPTKPGQYPPERKIDHCQDPKQPAPFAKPIHQSAPVIPFPASEVGHQNEIVADRPCAAMKPKQPIPSTKWFPTPQPATMQTNRPKPSSHSKQASTPSDEHSKQRPAISKAASEDNPPPAPTMASAACSKQAMGMPTSPKQPSQPCRLSYGESSWPITQTATKETDRNRPYTEGAISTPSALTSHQQTRHNNDETNRTKAASQQETSELAAIAKLLDSTQQDIAINNPPLTGGVIGFETSKRRKIQHTAKTGESKTAGEEQSNSPTEPNAKDSCASYHPKQDGKASDEGPQFPAPLQTPHTLQAVPRQIAAEPPHTGQLDQEQSITKSKEEEQAPRQQPFPVPSQEPTTMNHPNSPTEGAKHQHTDSNIPETIETSDKTIKIWIIRDDKLEPDEIKVPVGTTPGQLTQAEARLMTMVQPIFPRTWVGTPLPLYEPLQDKQVVYLHQQPPSIKCPAITGIQPTHVIQPPVCRIHVLWKQQAWVALDEMQFYLEGTIASEDTKVFQPETYFHEAAADEEAGVWLHRPLTEANDKSTFVSAAIVQGHWVPVMITRHDRCIQLTTTPEGSCFLRAAQEITTDLGLTLEVHQKVLPQAFAADCGFQAFAWIVAMSSGHQPTALPAHKAEQWRYMFAHHLLQTDHHTDIVRNIHLGGMKVDNETQQQLIQLLNDHGVWPDRVQDRAGKIMEKLPIATLKSILASKKPCA